MPAGGASVRRVTAIALGTLIVVSLVAALARWPDRSHTYAARRRPGPGLWLLAVGVLALLDQVLVSAYVLRVHHGDPAFITAYVGPGWFHIDRSPMLAELAGRLPAPHLLAPSVLRVPAFYELPFAVFAYLTVCRWFGVEAAARRMIWPASISYTAAFCLIEWHIPTPYTVEDIIIRGVSAMVMPMWAERWTAAPPPSPRLGPVGILGATVSAAALGWLVLAAYETVLLYNLGDLRTRLAGILVAGAVLTLARLVTRAVPDRAPGLGVDSVGSAFGCFLVVFFVPALAIRYGIGFGAGGVSAAAALALVGAGASRGLRGALQRHSSHGRARLLVVALLTCGSATAGALLSSGYAEMRLLWGAAAGLLAAITAAAIGDLGDRPKTSAETAS